MARSDQGADGGSREASTSSRTIYIHLVAILSETTVVLLSVWEYSRKRELPRIKNRNVHTALRFSTPSCPIILVLGLHRYTTCIEALSERETNKPKLGNELRWEDREQGVEGWSIRASMFADSTRHYYFNVPGWSVSEVT